jgi:POT family proton-dependent oligopeptide transporter
MRAILLLFLIDNVGVAWAWTNQKGRLFTEFTPLRSTCYPCRALDRRQYTGAAQIHLVRWSDYHAGAHYTGISGGTALFYTGLCVVALGTGLLKPNISTIVGELYPEGGARRDAAFSIFYMGITWVPCWVSPSWVI